MPNFPRRILLAVTGVSPQVVTETLYALGQQALHEPSGFIPTEVRLITTQTGKKHAVEHLLHKGQLPALLNDYPQLGHPLFDESHIHVICDDKGQPLDDISNEAENIQAANAITQLLAELTRDDHAALHVSLSGGRKTMGFYVGYAFSLFARPQDALSHVLVSSPFESSRHFFFPPAQPVSLDIGGASVSTADAQITLAQIPIVRLRHGLPTQLQAGDISYSDAVTAIQSSFAPPRLHIDLSVKQAICGTQHVKLPDALLAWLAWWAQLTLENNPHQSWRDFERNQETRQAFLNLYACLVKHNSDAYEKTYTHLCGKSNASFVDDSCKTFFQENNSKLKRKLEEQLGPAAKHYFPEPIGKRPHTTHRLPLGPDQIELIHTSP